MSLTDELKAHLELFHTAPFLFVGSGFSRRYLGLEDWDGLLRKFASLTGKPYEFFLSTANGDLPATATEIARALHDIWWSSPSFELSRERYKADARTRESAFKIEISQYLEKISANSPNSAELTRELELLPQATIDGILTTNWDLLLEHIFPEFESYVGQDELLFSPTHGIGEIYKIHGCCSNPNSLVATKDDYERFSLRNPYLAAKLLTVFAEHPVVFLGYSLADPNVTSILQSIAACLTNENIHELRDRLILVRWAPNEAVGRWEDHSIVTNGFSIPVKTVTTNSFLPVFECLAQLPRKFPARLLRRLKEQVYELVHDNDPASRLYVVNMDDETDASDVKVVYGVGLVQGGQVRLSLDPDAPAVRLTDDPNAPVIPFRVSPVESTYATTQAALDAFVRAWRTDPFAYIPLSSLRRFYAERLTLNLDEDSLRCLLTSAMHHHGSPIHFWALRIGRARVVPMLIEEINLDLYPRIRCATRLAFAVGLSQGDELLRKIAVQSKHAAVRNLAKRLLSEATRSTTIHSEYRSPVRSRHTVNGLDVVIDVTSMTSQPDEAERVITMLSSQTDTKSCTRLKQLDAMFYGTRI